MDELIKQLQEKTGLGVDQIKSVLAGVKDFLGDKLPGPLASQVNKFLGDDAGEAGDSGNDSEMFDTGFKGIVPHNAQDELKVVACRPWHYHSPLPVARGVLDGLRHFGFVEQEQR